MQAERDTSLTLEGMRAKRKTPEVCFKKFTESRKLFCTHAFCFYEGEDGKYYDSRIEKYWGANFISLPAGNKDNVLKVMQKIQSDPLYANVCVMFFVDRDYDTPLSNTNPDLFETPCYSVENLYAQESVLCRILKSEFGLNIIDSDYQKCLNDYRARLKEFNQSICKFNAIVKYQHQFAPDVNCRFSTIKTSNLAHITIGQVTKSCRHDSQIDKLVTLLSADQERLSTLEKELSQEENPQLTFRGKNQLDFFVAMIKLWRDLNDNGGYFAEKIERVHINISDNRLSELSQYADTPSELVGFLENHRLQIAS